MIITPRFVALNYPRTGSTFVREALRTLSGADSPLGRARERLGIGGFRELKLPIERTLSARRVERESQHGAYGQIPDSCRDRLVMSVTRHPLDRAVSMYEHGFWRTSPPGDATAIAERFPEFPELDFGRYLELQSTLGFEDVLQEATLKADVGPNTLHFVRFYWPDPERALARLTDASIDDGSFLAGMPDVRFLHTEALADELRGFLIEMGYEEQATAFLLDQPAVNRAASRAGRPWSEYFTQEQERTFRYKERLLFERFPEYAR